MRNIIFKDRTIPQAEYEKVLKDYAKFLKDTAGVDFTYTTIDYNFKDYPTEPDTDGLLRIKYSFITELKDIVQTKYGKYGTDNIKILIHEDNWKSDPTGSTGIWGTAWSYYFGSYHVQYLRWDKDNQANSFGTMNHEDDHGYDALIKTELGIDVNPILGVTNYDKMTTHGGRPDAFDKAYHGYIRFRENEKKLKVLSPYLKAAYQKRIERHNADIIGKKKQIVGLLEQVVYLYRQLLNKKTTIKK